MEYLEIVNHVQRICLECDRDPREVTIVAVSKGHTKEEVKSAFEAGCRNFGENRWEEAVEKMKEMPPEIHWHFIGSLQTKKINKVIGKYHLIHSVDCLKLAQNLSAASVKNGVVTNILLQSNTSGEITKHGCTPIEWKECIREWIQLPNLNVQGLMTMAPLTCDFEEVRLCFQKLRHLREDLQSLIGQPLPHLSMGMSHDYPIAIQEGATLLRIGTAIFEKM